jgi:ubiquinone/menaquinone biosynthesis C-methylase UbiE
LAPGLRSSQRVYYDRLSELLPESAAWLDLGCGHQVFASYMEAEERRVTGRVALFVGADLGRESLGRHRSLQRPVLARAERLPFSGGVFDIVTANMVVEHLENPPAAFAEAKRVLRPGGVLLVHTPNRHNFKVSIASRLPAWLKNPLTRLLEQRCEEDIYPTLYRCNTPEAVTAAARASDLRLSRLDLFDDTATFALIPPLAFFELLLIRLFRHGRFAALRSNMIFALANDGEPRRQDEREVEPHSGNRKAPGPLDYAAEAEGRGPVPRQ